MFEVVEVTHAIGTTGLSSVTAEVRMRRVRPESAATAGVVAAERTEDEDACDDDGVFRFRSRSSTLVRRDILGLPEKKNVITWSLNAPLPPAFAAKGKSPIAVFLDGKSTPSHLSVYCAAQRSGVDGRWAALRELRNMGNAIDQGFRPMFCAAARELHQVLFRTFARKLLRGMRALHFRRAVTRRACARVAIECMRRQRSTGGGAAALAVILASWLR